MIEFIVVVAIIAISINFYLKWKSWAQKRESFDDTDKNN
jgi:nitrogen fixation-related uncharacterized protein